MPVEFILSCSRTGRTWRHRTRGLAESAARSLGLHRFTITEAPRQ